jgi:hypothetical protein
MKVRFTILTEPDPAGDDYTFYLNTSGSILERYKIIMELMGTLMLISLIQIGVRLRFLMKMITER